MKATRNYQRLGAGFTLIELLVAMFIALALAVALVLLQASLGRQTARTQDVAARDDHARLAMDRIAGDLSSAGFLFGGTQVICNALFSFNNTASAVATRHQVDALAASSGLAPAFAPSLTLNYPASGVISDVLVVTGSSNSLRFNDATAPLINVAPSPTIRPTTTGTVPLVSTSGLSAGDTGILQVPLSGKRACVRVPISTVQAGVSASGASGSIMPSNYYAGFSAAMTGAGFASGLTDAAIYQGQLVDIGTAASSTQFTTIYYVSSPNGGYPALMRATYNLVDDSLVGAPQAIAAGVISLQVRFGVDPGNTGAVTEYDTAATLNANKTWDFVRSVRVLLVGRPLVDDPDPTYTWPSSPNVGVPSPFTDFAIPTSPADMRHRRYSIQQVEIAARNELWH